MKPGLQEDGARSDLAVEACGRDQTVTGEPSEPASHRRLGLRTDPLFRGQRGGQSPQS